MHIRTVDTDFGSGLDLF